MKAKTEATATEAKAEKKAKAKKLDSREVVTGVKAIVRKQGEISIQAGQAVYKTDKAYCIFDVAANRRIAWIPAKRVKDVVFEGKNGGTTTVKGEAKTKKPRAKKAA